MQLSVIIVSYNIKYFLEQCLYSVKDACKNIEAEIFVVDNASPDNTIEFLQPKFPGIFFIKNNENFGYAKANNKALPLCKGKYILYLNPDTILPENILISCIDFFEKNNTAGAVSVKMIDGSGNFLPESKRAFPSITASFWKMTGMAKMFTTSSVFNKYALGNLNEDEVHEVDVLCGAFFISRKNILIELKGFDEDYFMYGEDIDLSYRIQKKGYKNYYLGNNTIVHFKGESTQKQKANYVHHFYDAMKIFVRKHHTKPTSFFLNAAIDISKKIALLKHQSVSQKKQKTNFKFLLAGENEDVESVKKILSVNNHSTEKIDLNNLNLNTEKQNIVFCIGNFLYKDAINFMQKNKNKFYYYWHNLKSESTVGSNLRNATGEIYAKS